MYDFDKGTPWQHEDLFAQSDFTINKLPEEIQMEEDSIKNNAKLYFVYDASVKEQQITAFQEDFEIEWRKVAFQDSMLRASDLKYRRTPKLNKTKYLTVLNRYIKIIDQIYEKCVYDPSEISDYNAPDDYKLVFNKDDLVKTYLRSQVYTLKTSYQQLSTSFAEEINKTDDENVKNFFDKFPADKYISQNLFFDRDKTEEIKELAIENISKTRGQIQTDELIIARGEIISLDKYRILMTLKSDYENSSEKNSILLIHFGNAVIIFVLVLMLILFLKHNKPKIFNDISSFLMVFILLVFFVSLYSIVIKFSLFNVYIIPLAIIPLTLKIFFDERVSLFVLLITIFLVGFIVPNSFEFVIIQFVSSYAAIIGFSQLSRRGQLYWSAASVFLSMSLIYFAKTIIHGGALSNIESVNFLYFGINSILLMTVYPLVYGLERIFGFISDITLLELSNTNHHLLQKLATTTPGTFQHSLQVASLAESAANEINANALLVRVGALYHDIGKINSPAFFIENQVSGFNPHDQIEFDQSAKIIISHVTNGITMATKSKLPQQIIDFIRTHHGTTTVQYFYKNYIKKYPEKKDEIDNFTYPGPRPFSKETAILMMADSIEAASRSLKEINHDTISNLVENIINHQMELKQFEEADINFKEISTLKKLFKERLINIYHARIEYPK